MVIKDIIYIMVVALFRLIVGSRWSRFHVESNCCHLVYLRRKLLLLVGSKWNMFHMEPDCFMPRNNIADSSDTACLYDAVDVAKFASASACCCCLSNSAVLACPPLMLVVVP